MDVVRFGTEGSAATCQAGRAHILGCTHDWPSIQSWDVLLGGSVCLAEVVGNHVVEYTRHAKSGSYYSHIQASMLPIAMTAAIQRTRQSAKAPEPTLQRQQQLIRRRAEALESSSSVGPQMLTGAASVSRTTNTRRGRCLAPFARSFFCTAIATPESGWSCSWEMQRLVHALLL